VDSHITVWTVLRLPATITCNHLVPICFTTIILSIRPELCALIPISSALLRPCMLTLYKRNPYIYVFVYYNSAALSQKSCYHFVKIGAKSLASTTPHRSAKIRSLFNWVPHQTNYPRKKISLYPSVQQDDSWQAAHGLDPTFLFHPLRWPAGNISMELLYHNPSLPESCQFASERYYFSIRLITANSVVNVKQDVPERRGIRNASFINSNNTLSRD
jgi:hypothetical protein